MLAENDSVGRWVSLRSFGEVFLQRAKTKGTLWVVLKATEKVAMWIAWALLLPVAVVGHLLGYRRLTIFTDRIGHLAGELDCFEKERRLGRLPAGCRWFVLAPPGRVANAYLLAYWRPFVSVITNPIACRFLSILAKKGPMVHDVSDYILSFGASARYYEVNAEWGNRPPILALTESDALKRDSLLSELGLPPGAWFVCFHVREGGYSRIDEVIHSHRNAAIENYIDAMRFIVDQGGWCIRIGDPSMKPLPEIPGVIDYVHSPLRSEAADVLLCASCRFFVGTSSGLFIVASVFGVPCVLTNMIPISTLGYSPRDVSIPKRLLQSSGGREIPFQELFKESMSNFRLSSQFRQAGIAVLENTPDEILDVVREMYGVVRGERQDDSDADALQARFRGLFRPIHYGYRAKSRVGTSFLRRHRPLFLEDDRERDPPSCR